MNKSYRNKYLQNSLPGGELSPGLPRDRRGYLPLYYKDLMLEKKSNVFASALQIKLIAVKVSFKESSPVKANVITLLHGTKIPTQIIKNK